MTIKTRGNAMAHETETLAGYVADLKFEDIPPQVLERAKVLTLDFLGSAIRARRDAESTPSLLKMLGALALDSKGEATVFGDSKTWTPAVAALLNGALGHSLDFDDTHADSSLHASAPVVPAWQRARPHLALRARLPSDRDRRHIWRGGCRRKTVRAIAQADRRGLRRVRQPGRGLAAVPGQRRLEQALSGRRRRHERRDRRHAGAQRLRRLDRIRRGQARPPGRLQ